jgi:tetratricopeptide (TPR) repeat protein
VVDRADERDVRQEMSAELDFHAANDQLVAGDIPEQRPGFLPRPLLVRLNRTRQQAPVVQVLTGTAGTGKTQLAAAYARAKLAAGWRFVAWVNAGNAGSLMADLAAVADAAGLSDGAFGPDPADAGQAVRRWLEADGQRCLLVFDDAQDPEMLRPFVPVSGAARVLITADRESMENLGTSHAVDVLSAEEALALLSGRTGLDDESGAGAVAAELGYLPLALDQAAAAIAGRHTGYAPYLERIRAMSADYLMEGEKPYPPGTLEAVRLSLDEAAAADPAGVGIGVLEVMAVLSAAGIRRQLLHVAGEAGVLSGGRLQVAAGRVDQVLAQLAEQALLTFTVDHQSVIMHRLTARVAREGLARRGLLAAVCRAAAFALEKHAEALEASQDPAAARDVPRQVTALLENAAGPVSEGDEELAGTLLRLRFLALYHLIELGDSMPQAIAIGEPLTADLERLLGPDHPDTLNATNSLAAAYLAAGRTAEAIPLFERTLVGQIRRQGHDHPDTLTAQNNLAATYQDAGRPGEAILLFRLTLAAKERLLGADHASTLNSRGNLAAAFLDAGRIAEAIPLLEQTLAGREELLGPDHPDTQRSRQRLTAAYQEAGQRESVVPPPRSEASSEPSTIPNPLFQPVTVPDSSSQAAPVFDGDGDADVVVGDGDDDGEGEPDGVGEGDLDGVGEGDLDGLDDADLDGLGEGGGGTYAGGAWVGDGDAVRDRLGDGLAVAGEEMAVGIVDVVTTAGLVGTGRRAVTARAGRDPVKASTETLTAATTHITTTTVAVATPGLARTLSHFSSLINPPGSPATTASRSSWPKP